jgi:hypothetical protein
MRSANALLILLTLCGSACAADPAPHQSVQPQSIASAVAKASAWLEAHPAGAQQYEVVGVEEEMMLYYVLEMLAPDGPKSADYRREIASRHQALVWLNREALSMSHDARPYLQGIWGQLTYPPAAHIVAKLGMDAFTYLAIVDDVIASHPYLYPPREAMQVWIWVYLDRLERGALYSEAHTHALRVRVSGLTLHIYEYSFVQTISW